MIDDHPFSSLLSATTVITHKESHITTIFTAVFVEGTGAMAFVSGEDKWTTPKVPKRVSVFGMILSYH